jgi:hypothetical protein
MQSKLEERVYDAPLGALARKETILDIGCPSYPDALLLVAPEGQNGGAARVV